MHTDITTFANKLYAFRLLLPFLCLSISSSSVSFTCLHLFDGDGMDTWRLLFLPSEFLGDVPTDAFSFRSLLPDTKVAASNWFSSLQTLLSADTLLLMNYSKGDISVTI